MAGHRSPLQALKHALRRTVGAFGGAIEEFFADGCTKLAAAISYYALLAIFPLAILLVAVAALVLDDQQARSDIIQAILDRFPLREDAGRADLEELLRAATSNSRATGAIGLVLLLFSASGVMGALRFALNTVWNAADQRPPVRGKALDVAMVLLAGLVVAASLGLTFLAREVSETTAAELGPVGAAIAEVVLAAGQLIPAVLAFVVFALLYRYVPALDDIRWSGVALGALVAAAGYELTKTAFALYLENVANLSAIYASLGTVVAFLLFVWLTANVFLFGAEVAEAWPRQTGEPDPEGEPLGQRVRGLLRGLVVRPAVRAEGRGQAVAPRDER